MAAEPKTVTLIDPNGDKVKVATPADITNLVYGQGYRIEGKLSPTEAAELLADKGPVANDLPLSATAAPSNTVTETKK